MRKSQFTDKSDDWCAPRCCGRLEGAGRVRSAWDHRADELPLEEQVCDLEVPGAGRLKKQRDENRRLKRLVADQALNIQLLKDDAGKGWCQPRSGGRPSRTCERTGVRERRAYRWLGVQ